MTQYTVTVIDTTGKQNYIFNSNRLRENIGASFLLSQATKDWVKTILEQNLNFPMDRQEEAIEGSKYDAEIIYANGGNALIIFKSLEIAVRFTQILSKKVLEKAPGINLLVAHKEFDWDNDDLYEVVEELKKHDIERQKYERMSSVPLLGLGVNASCNSTLLPAVDRSDKDVNYGDEEDADSYLVSTETKKKLEVVSEANNKLQEIFKGEVDQNIYKFPYRTDHLGRSKGESSYVAIIHADGNGMGKRFKQYGEESKNNRDYITRMRNLSHRVDLAGINALKAVARVLAKSIEQGKVVGNLGKFNLNAQYYFPFRPLVYAGDDITFICEGRIGIELAALFLREFEEQLVPGGKLTACAGVCVVKTHYPFARAYAISEELCKSAKKFVKEDKDESFLAMDWHLAASGLIGSISDIRDREYKVGKDYDLTMRPIRLEKNSIDWRTWEGLTQVIKKFKTGEDWRGRHNKIMDLREVLRQASDKAVEDFLRNYKLSQLQLPLFPESSGKSEQLAKDGWLNKRCGYFMQLKQWNFI